MNPRYVSVALPVPLFRTFTYTAGEELAGRAVPGARVVVAVRGRKVIGLVVGDESAPRPARDLQPILEAPDEVPSLPAGLFATCRWLADYYAAPLGLALRGALPALLTGAHAPAPAPRTRRSVALVRPIASLMERDALFRRAPRQREVVELLEALGGRASAEHLERQLGVSQAVITALVRRGLARIERESVLRDGFGAREIPAQASPTPTAAQHDAIDRITAGRAGEVFLLHGVTGSGKTLVYIEVLRRVVEERGRTAIVLVPEIALTPQTVDRFRAAFGDRIAVLHSALSDGERLDAWRAIRRGERRIVVGARSAIFAPMEHLGAVIVDEEHETSYKQGETPRYHARDVAIVRARQEGAVVVLGSATPSLESWANARRSGYTLLSLPERVGGGSLPRVSVVDLRRKPGQDAGPPDPFRRVISEPLERALRAAIARGEQAILLLNRRGYAAFVQCSSCGYVVSCPNCSISLTVHRTPERLVCHYCAHAEPFAWSCRKCAQPTVRERGLGTQQVERLLSERLPTARIARMDVDTTSGKWAHATILDRVARHEVDVLLGTQMIAKGLDYPNVTLVGVVDADVGMNLPDFRSAERAYQLMAQVSGRAGRGPKGGLVFIQTRLPDHHAVRAALAHDYAGFVRQELADRQTPAYPPTVRLANVVFSGLREDETARLAQRGADWLTRLVARHGLAALDVIGPAPCPIERIKARWRWHVMLKAVRAADLTRVIRYFAARFPVPHRAGLRLIIDRDPAALL
ncbi:MAG TPA: primosomal protein N' [Gemmatimonadaceae bacterium]|nr:primosomal protein N' [Gemmatimonadaceae bacterium]